MSSIEHLVSDLAPGDSESSTFDWSRYEIRKVVSVQDPLFEMVYEKFLEEFGPKREIEERSILAQRLKWDSKDSNLNYLLKYEILVVTQNGKFSAARDYSAIIRKTAPLRAVVHLSHSLIDPAHRGLGMAGWLRAWPIQTVRSCLLTAGLPSDTPITLVAEMEPYQAKNLHDTGARYKSYQRAGYQMIDPHQVSYLQPDFRSPAIIDREGGTQPIPLQLVLRRLGREKETTLPGAEVRDTVSALYEMYGNCFRPQDMVPLWEHLRNFYPADEAQVNLVGPSMNLDRGLNRDNLK